ncbi:MAG: hypothetical protein HKM05_06935 [Spirochaetales bacterium]|nr:hypothetical protein [Spirochaetales bacterium]
MEQDSVEQDTVYGKIYCANCAHCKVVRVPAGDGSQYLLRIRCAAGKWKTRNGVEKLYKYFTITRRSLLSCESYCSMGDTRGYLRQLRSLLPQKDETYTQNPETLSSR